MNFNNFSIIRITKNNIRNVSILRELFFYRQLILILFYRDLVSSYKQTILGPLWIIINPLVTSFVFTIVFSKVANIPTDTIPPFLFYFSALTIWIFFQSNVLQISNFFNLHRDFFSKVYFARLSVPCAYILTNTVKFLIQLFILYLFCYFIYDYKIIVNFTFFITLILIFIYTCLFSLAIGLFLNSFTFKYRDLTSVIAFGLNIWMYLSPIVYPISQAPEKLKIILLLNPMTSVIEVFRYSLFKVGTISFYSIGVSIFFLIFFFIIGIYLFKKTESNFIDVV